MGRSRKPFIFLIGASIVTMMVAMCIGKNFPVKYVPRIGSLDQIVDVSSMSVGYIQDISTEGAAARTYLKWSTDTLKFSPQPGDYAGDDGVTISSIVAERMFCLQEYGNP